MLAGNFFHDKSHLAGLCIIIVMLGFFMPAAFMSVGMISLVVLAFVRTELPSHWKAFPRFFPVFQWLGQAVIQPDKSATQLWTKHRILILISLPFLWLLLSVLWTNNTESYAHLVQIQLPFIALPFAFAAMPFIGQKSYRTLSWLLCGLCSFLVLGVLLNYGINYEVVNQGILKGKAVPTPINHIRFSMLASICALLALHLTKSAWLTSTRLVKLLSIGSLAILVIGIHILAVRSGLITLYIGLAVYTIARLIITKRYTRLIPFLLLLLAGPYLAYQFVPSVQHKVDFMKWDYHNFKHGNIHYYPDARRIVSFQGAIALFKSAPLLGSGYGDLKDGMAQFYSDNYPSMQRDAYVNPHNQFLYHIAGGGMIGFLLFCIAWFGPVIYYRAWKDPMFMAFFAMITVSFLVEATLETQRGISIGLFLYLFLLLPIYQRS